MTKFKGSKKFSRLLKQKRGKYLVFVDSPFKRAGQVRDSHVFGIDLDGLYPVIVDSYNDLPLYFDKRNFLYSVWEQPALITVVHQLSKQ